MWRRDLKYRTIADLLLRYVPWDEDFDLEFTQTLHLEKSETSDGFEMAFSGE